MGIKKRILPFILTVLLFFASIQIGAEEVLKAGRIYPYMPDITVELSGMEQIDSKDVSAVLGERVLHVEDIHPYDKKQDSSRIYVLVDVSTSMSERFEVLKQQLSVQMDQTGPNDQVVLLSFGEQVTQVLGGTEDVQTRKQAINSLSPQEDGTVLFKALNQAYELSSASQSAFDREYIVLLTDGIDYQKGHQTYSEVEEKFREHFLPIYTICTENATQEAADSLGTLSRMSGGTFLMAEDGQETECFQNMQNIISAVNILKLKADSNQVTGQKELLSIQAAGKTVEQKIEISRFIPDNEAPRILSVKMKEDNKKAVIHFSENVQHADEDSAIRIIDSDGNAALVKKAEYIKEDCTADVYLEEPLKPGNYTIHTQGITDVSQEKNALEDYKGAVTIEKTKKGFPWKAAAALAAVLLIAGIIAAVVMAKKKKQPEYNRKRELEAGKVLNIEGQPVIKEDTYHIKQGDSRQLNIYMKLADGMERRFYTNAISSLIFGRGKNCDVVVEDEKMSRQHFALVLDQDQLIISDLNSANGTKVNGVPLSGRRILKSGDQIQAGQTLIVIME